MKFLFSRSSCSSQLYPSPFGNFGRDDFYVTDVRFLMCKGIPGLIEKLRMVLLGKEVK